MKSFPIDNTWVYWDKKMDEIILKALTKQAFRGFYIGVSAGVIITSIPFLIYIWTKQ